MKTLMLSSVIVMELFVSAIRNNPEKSSMISGSQSIKFNNTVDGAALILGNKTYKNAHGDAFTDQSNLDRETKVRCECGSIVQGKGNNRLCNDEEMYGRAQRCDHRQYYQNGMFRRSDTNKENH